MAIVPGFWPLTRPSIRSRCSVDTAGAFFHAHGAMLVNEKGDITVKTDKVRQALEYLRKLAQFLPPDAPAWMRLLSSHQRSLE